MRFAHAQLGWLLDHGVEVATARNIVKETLNDSTQAGLEPLLKTKGEFSQVMSAATNNKCRVAAQFSNSRLVNPEQFKLICK